jgi:type IV pilus assembly protein PilB
MADMTTGVPAANASVTFETPVRELGTTKVPYEVLRYIPEESASHYEIVPLTVAEGVLEVGMVDPDDLEGVDALNFIARTTGMPYKVFKISKDDFDKVISMYRGLTGDVEKAVSDLKSEQGKEAEGTEEGAPLDLGSVAYIKQEDENAPAPKITEDAPAIKLVSTILRYAIDGHASDIHVEPQTSGVRVRYRVDGELHTSVILPISTHRTLVARVKILASLRLDEQRKPQDGRFSAAIDNRKIDFRVSTFPTHNGEKVVIRILDRDQGYIPLDQIGLSPRALESMRRAVAKPHGLILVSGPTGSGKSTTLYSILSELDREKKNVLSLEDPIEYFVDGVTQSQVRPEIGYTFANGLRTTLRQDPDVIMVGEIRDSETAKLAMQAALTGHLVLSTIHTNDAVGTIPRLIDMGIEPYLIPPVLIASIAQRLVHTLCPGSGKEFEITASDKLAIEADLASLPERFRFPIPKVAYEPEPTATCPTGMRGRLAVFEVLEMSSAMERVILENPVQSKLWDVARANGMLTMREDAMLKAFDKKIPYTEVNTLSSILMSADEQAQNEKIASELASPPTSVSL